MNSSLKAAATLVARCPILQSGPTGTLFITISPNPRTIIKYNDTGLRGKKLKHCYGGLRHKEQYDYCMTIFKTCYLSLLAKSEYVGTWELNQQGNVHFHAIIYSPDVINDYTLQVFRRDVYHCELTQQNLKHKNAKDYMNNIVLLNKSIPDICTYLDKDHDQRMPVMISKDMSNYCSHAGDELELSGSSIPQVLPKKKVRVHITRLSRMLNMTDTDTDTEIDI